MVLLLGIGIGIFTLVFGGTFRAFTQPSKPWYRRVAWALCLSPVVLTGILAAVLVGVLVLTPIGLYMLISHTIRERLLFVGATYRFFHNRLLDYRLASRRLPASKPIISAETVVLPNPNSSTGRGFHDLPLEIRQHVYRLVFRAKLVFQFDTANFKLPVQSLVPEDPTNHIRKEGQRPSYELYMRYRDRDGSIDAQTPPNPHLDYLNGASWLHADMLRVSRKVYNDVLDELYGPHTFYLFGTETVFSFLNTVSPEGLPRIQYVHLTLTLSQEGRGFRRWARHKAAIDQLASALTGLRQLSVELVIDTRVRDFGNDNFGSDKEEEFWRWVTMEAFEGFHDLDKFVIDAWRLQIVIYEGRGGDQYQERFARVGEWNRYADDRLKRRLMGKGTCI